ncbi:hypothetical protein BMS3Abin03_00528 [bacterium BMS3Abin03]|nr:hypothetical protein BMS3Abin03_00528 [bacterium BMS3Abin03]
MIELKDITERDIFNFVFFPETLSAEKFAFLEKKEGGFEPIKFYRHLKKAIESDITDEIRKKIAEKIPAYKLTKVIKLFPVKDELPKRTSDVPILAAASAAEEPAVIAKTFVDSDKTFLIRLLRMGNKTKIFTFPITHTDRETFQLTLHPEEETFTIHNNEAIELEGKHEVESISVEVG